MVKRAGLENLDEIIHAGAASEQGLDTLVKQLGLDVIGLTLVDEIAFRALPSPIERHLPVDPDSANGWRVSIGITHGAESVRYLLATPLHGPVTLEQDDGQDVAVQLDYQLFDLIRVLFGPEHERPIGTHAAMFMPPPQPGNTQGTDVPAPEVLMASMHSTSTVMSGLTQSTPDLNELATRFKTDKWGGLHWFTGLYERHFRSFRDQPVRVLEIGVGGWAHPQYGGGSLRMWKRYFRRGQVFGVDVFDKSAIDEQRLYTLIADQSKPEMLLELDDRYGPFDIVIDDGSHVNGHVLTSLRTLFPRLRSGGLYVIEDLWTTYATGYGGDDAAPASDRTSIGMLKDILEGLHYEEQPEVDPRRTDYLARHVVGMHVYRNIAFLEKGINSDGGVPGWVDRTPPTFEM